MAPLTHSSKSPVQSVIIGTRSTLPPLALTSPGQRRRNCVEEYFSGCPPASFEPCQATQGRRRGEGLRWKLAVPGPLWGTGGSASPKGRRPKCGAGGGGGDILLEGKYSLAFSARGGLRHATGGRAYTNILDPYAGTDMDTYQTRTRRRWHRHLRGRRSAGSWDR